MSSQSSAVPPSASRKSSKDLYLVVGSFAPGTESCFCSNSDNDHFSAQAVAQRFVGKQLANKYLDIVLQPVHSLSFIAADADDGHKLWCLAELWCTGNIFRWLIVQ